MNDVKRRAQERFIMSEREKAAEAQRKQIGSYHGDKVKKIAARTGEAAGPEGKLRVAAYCRVSTDDIDQVISIELQKDEYQKKIKNNPAWEYMGTYVDDGFSGTNTEHRPGFRLMMQAAMDGKLDVIAETEWQSYAAIQRLKEVGVIRLGEPSRDEAKRVIMTYILNLREGYSKPVLSMIQALLDSKRSQKDHRIGTVLSANLDNGCVEYSDYEETGDEARWQSDMKFACQLGLLTQVTETRYTINRELGPGLAQMDRGQKKLASRLFDAFGQGSFTTEMFLATLDYSETHAHASLHAFTLMGILDCTEGETFSYQFRFTPEEHPECFEQAA